jgi:hypothetical protein
LLLLPQEENNAQHPFSHKRKPFWFPKMAFLVVKH